MRLSFSQVGTYENCKLQYYYSYVKKYEQKDVETKYLRFGSCVHETLENYYKEKLPFMYYLDKFWKKYNLEKDMDKEVAIRCVKNGIKRGYTPTAPEKRMYITTPISFIGIFDIIDEKNSIIADFKTSTYSKENEEEYKQQLLCYAWLYYMKTGELIQKSVLDFVKADKVFEWLFTEEDVMKFNNYITNKYDEIAEFRMQDHKEEEVPRNIQGCHWCGYKYRCPQYRKELQYTLTIRGSRFFIEQGEITPLLEKGIQQVFSYKPQGYEWSEKYKKGVWDGHIRFWNKRTKSLPLGFFKRFKNLLVAYAKQKGLPIHINVINTHSEEANQNLTQLSTNSLRHTVLRDYQKEAANTAVKDGTGFVQVPTSGGKTIIAAEILRLLDKKSLFIVDKKELVIQAKETFEKELGVEVGLIASGEVETDKQITIATIQSLNAKRGKLVHFLSTIGCVIVDEAHHSSSVSYTKLFSIIKNANHRIGITATVRREGGDEMQFHSIIGDIIYDVDLNTLVKEGFVMKPKVYFVDYEKDSDFVKTDYNEYYVSQIVDNDKRNEIAKEAVFSLVRKNMQVLVLTKRIEHAKSFYEKVKEEIDDVAMILGETNTSDRESVFDLFRNGDLKVLIGTQSIFSEGVNIVTLNAIVNLSANKGEIKTIQTIGRVMRTLSGKKKSLYLDFNDHHLFGKAHSKKRRKILEDMGYEVEKWDK